MADTPEIAHADGADAPAAPAERNDSPGPDVPARPTDLSGGSWLAAGQRTIREFGNDTLTDRAAALTYYGVLSIFPGLLVVVSLLGLIGKSATQPLITNLGHAAPGAVRQTYGSIAAVIIFLVWLWVSNLAILLGAEFDAELERGRAVAVGVPLGQEPYVQPRDLRKLRKSRS